MSSNFYLLIFYIFLHPDKPSVPQNVRVTEFSKDYMIVTWDVPETDGGSPITGYSLEKRDITRSSCMNVENVSANVLRVKATKLIEGKEYVFQVCAENSIGVSDWAITPEPVLAKLPFGKVL